MYKKQKKKKMKNPEKKRKITSKYSVGSLSSRAMGTANSSTRGSMMEISNDIIIVSIVENRTKEIGKLIIYQIKIVFSFPFFFLIGIAVYNLKSPHLILSQFSDKFSYSHTITQLHLYQPAEIIIPISLSNSDLSNVIKENFPNSVLTTQSRQYYSVK